MDPEYWRQLNEGWNGFISSVQKTTTNLSNEIYDIRDKLPAVDKWVPRPDPRAASPVLPPTRRYQGVPEFVARHRNTLLGTLLFVLGSVGGLVCYNRTLRPRILKFHSKRRLATRAPDGGREEVVLIIGSLREPLVRFTAIDLSNRGYIVYITATPEDEATLVHVDSDYVRSLSCVSYSDARAVASCLKDLKHVLRTKVRSFANAQPHSLKLTGVIVCPDLFYPTGPVETAQPTTIFQSVAGKLGLAMNLFSGDLLELARLYASKIVFMTPSNIGNLNPAFHAAESSTYAALSAFSTSLARELGPQGVRVVRIDLGAFDCSGIKVRAVHGKDAGDHAKSTVDEPVELVHPERSGEKQIESNVRADVLAWPQSMRVLYGNRYLNSSSLLVNQIQGSSLQALFRAVADALHPPLFEKSVIHVGRGSLLYAWLKSLLPSRVMTAFLNLRMLNSNFTSMAFFSSLFPF